MRFYALVIVSFEVESKVTKKSKCVISTVKYIEYST